ncbi:HAD-IIB family hydrolase [Amphritea sp.]|uniref:HAD-IIB family hydrolase n=1 Tax=Amphritea sp. TaxID=1872502 RepID=UPI003D14A633
MKIMVPPLDAALLPGHIRYLLTDVDDTITTQGKLLPQTLQALYDLKEAGIRVIPVTGGSAGWCDQIIRLWPVDAVIGENGAFHMELNTAGHLQLHSWHEETQRREYQQRLLALTSDMMSVIPELKLAKDQSYRLADVALDYNQDGCLTQDQISQVVTFFHTQGACARVSSIHINAWFGEYSKLAMARRLLQNKYQLSEAEMIDQVAYVGDSPNDEVMFGFFRHTFGVANIRPYLVHMTDHPNTILRQPGGLGFAELAQLLLQAQTA